MRGKLYQSSCYCTNLRRSANVVTDFYGSVLKNAGLTVAQYYLLINLSRLEAANITQWAERVGLDRSTMVRNVKLLESKGWISPAAGKGKVFSLSPEGRQVLDQAIPLWQDAQAQMETLLGKEDAAAFFRIHEKLQHMMEA